MHWWTLAMVADGTIAVAYLAIAAAVGRGLAADGQWRDNPLATATAMIFLSCGIGHGLHLVHLLSPSVSLADHAGSASRLAENEWHTAPWEAVTVAVAIYYWSLRGRFPALLRGTALFEDLRQRQRQALDVHDNVVQGLAMAKMSLELGRTSEGIAMLDSTLSRSRRIVTDLLGPLDSETALRAGDLRRRTSVDMAADSTPVPRPARSDTSQPAAPGPREHD